MAIVELNEHDVCAIYLYNGNSQHNFTDLWHFVTKPVALIPTIAKVLVILHLFICPQTLITMPV